LNIYKETLKQWNSRCDHGDLADALVGADLFIGVSKPNIVTTEMVASMADQPMIFALSNPNPEITLEDAKA